MNRREFLHLGMTGVAGLIAFENLRSATAAAAAADKGAAKKITAKDILKEGQPATIANYCEKPDKQPNKFCPAWKDKPGHCDTCMFFNKDNSLTEFKGGKFARCQLLTDATKPQFVSDKAWCATFVQKQG